MSDTIHLNLAVKNLKNSPAFQPFSGVRIYAGEDENGNKLVYEAGDSSWRVLELNNPWGTQQIANAILAKIQGYSFKPYTAEGAIVDPAVELGDSLYVGDVYSVINSIETTFSPIMSATLAALEDSTIDHEYPYQSVTDRMILRSANEVKTSFTVALGKIQATIAETYETKDDASYRYTSLSSQITQTANSITQSVSATYETKSAANAKLNEAKGYTDSTKTTLEATITLTANSITQSVSQTYETKQNASTMYNTLSSSITQTANSITQTVSQTYATKTALSSVQQTADKITWIIKSGTSSTNFELTDKAIKLVTDTIDLTGFVTFSSLTTAGSTSINGSNITTGKISASLIDADNLVVRRIYGTYSESGRQYDQVILQQNGNYILIGTDGGHSQYNYVRIEATRTVTLQSSGLTLIYGQMVFDLFNRQIIPDNSLTGWSLGTSNNKFGYLYVKGITSVLGNTYSSITIGMSKYDGIGFFGTTPIARQSLSTNSTNMGYTAATADNYLVILNNICGILKNKYGLIE